MTDRPKRETAVALSYRPDQGDEAPRVVASGKGELARQILDLAFAAGVKVREDADLVEILAAVDLDSPVPLEALMAVAEILTYVYLANGRMPETAAGAAP
jgi:flagellar biosynthesis protein